MRTTLLAMIAAACLTASFAVLPVTAQQKPSVTPSATDKVIINGRALNMSNIAPGAQQRTEQRQQGSDEGSCSHGLARRQKKKDRPTVVARYSSLRSSPRKAV